MASVFCRRHQRPHPHLQLQPQAVLVYATGIGWVLLKRSMVKEGGHLALTGMLAIIIVVILRVVHVVGLTVCRQYPNRAMKLLSKELHPVFNHKVKMALLPMC